MRLKSTCATPCPLITVDLLCLPSHESCASSAYRHDLKPSRVYDPSPVFPWTSLHRPITKGPIAPATIWRFFTSRLPPCYREIPLYLSCRPTILSFIWRGVSPACCCLFLSCAITVAT